MNSPPKLDKFSSLNSDVISLSTFDALAQQLKKEFEEADIKKKSVLDEKEFELLINKIIPNVTSQESKKLFKKFDVNNIGKIEYYELLHTQRLRSFIKEVLGVEVAEKKLKVYDTENLLSSTSTTPQKNFFSPTQFVIASKTNEIIDEYKNRLSALQEYKENNENLKQEFNSLKQEYETIESVNKKLNLQISTLKDEINNLQNENIDMKHQNKTIKRQSKNLIDIQNAIMKQNQNKNNSIQPSISESKKQNKESTTFELNHYMKITPESNNSQLNSLKTKFGQKEIIYQNKISLQQNEINELANENYLLKQELNKTVILNQKLKDENTTNTQNLNNSPTLDNILKFNTSTSKALQEETLEQQMNAIQSSILSNYQYESQQSIISTNEQNIKTERTNEMDNMEHEGFTDYSYRTNRSTKRVLNNIENKKEASCVMFGWKWC